MQHPAPPQARIQPPFLQATGRGVRSGVSQDPAGTCFLCRRAGASGPGMGDWSRCFAESLPPPPHLPPCSTPHCQFVCQCVLYSLNSLQQVPGHLLLVPFPAPSPVRLIGGLCWKHFKRVFSLLRLVVRRLLSEPNVQLLGLAFCP